MDEDELVASLPLPATRPLSPADRERLERGPSPAEALADRVSYHRHYVWISRHQRREAMRERYTETRDLVKRQARRDRIRSGKSRFDISLIQPLESP